MSAFETRVPPPLLGLLLAVLMWGVARLTFAVALPALLHWPLAGLLFVLAGVFAFPAFAAFGRAHTTINPVRVDAATALVTGGIYRITRNPMYVGMLLLLLAWAVALAAPWALLGPAVFVGWITQLQIAPEERALEAAFGAPYAAYRARVRRWI